jgi:hypothetical protein
VRDGIARRVQYVAKHLAVFPLEKGNQVFFAEAVIVFREPLHLLVGLHAVGKDCASQMAHNSSIKCHLPQLAAGVGIGL